uniref:RGS domain-containing protein n=1 Tax=Amazona collaria TaxID=241587 RepID=A0A8B9FTB0_9PSIT
MAWSESVDTILANKDGLAAFRTFLKSEFSEENVEFWLACEDFKKTKSSAKIASKAQKIYSDFIQADAPKEVNSFLCVLWVLRMGFNWKVQMQTLRNNRKYNSMGLFCILTSIIYQVGNTAWDSVKQNKTFYGICIFQRGHGFISPSENSTLIFNEIYIQYSLFSLTILIM